MSLSLDKVRSKISKDKIEYLCGLSAATCSVLATFPINKIIFRQSLWGFQLGDAFRQLKLEGLGYLYRGALPPVIIKSLSSSVMFGAFNSYANMLRTNPITANHVRDRPLLTSFYAAMLGGSTEALLTPFERVQMLLQDGRLNVQYRNTADALVKLRRYGIAEYYRGLTAVLLRNGPTTFIYFACKEPLKAMVLRSSGSQYLTPPQMDALGNFITGALLGGTISTIFYPLNVLRIQMMVQEVGSKHLSIFETAKNLYKERFGKWNLLLKGIHVNAVRSVLHWGCMTLFYEHIRNIFIPATD